jgi:hypothetical protein
VCHALLSASHPPPHLFTIPPPPPHPPGACPNLSGIRTAQEARYDGIMIIDHGQHTTLSAYTLVRDHYMLSSLPCPSPPRTGMLAAQKDKHDGIMIDHEQLLTPHQHTSKVFA